MNLRKSTDSRFLKKILTDDEISLVKSSSAPDAALWSIWACKEAAYKVFHKMSGVASFIPRRWTVFWETAPENSHTAHHLPSGFPKAGRDDGGWSGFVHIPDFCKVFFHLNATHLYVHSIASESREALEGALWRIDELPRASSQTQADPSSFVRSRLTHHLAGLQGLGGQKIEIIRLSQNGQPGPPLVYLNGRPSTIDISLSHDGDFTAFSYLSARPAGEGG